MKTVKKVLCFIMVIAMVSAVFPNRAEAAYKIKLNKKKVTLTITDKKKNPSAKLKVKGRFKRVKWSSSDKSVAVVKNGKVTAKGAGSATVTCRVTRMDYRLVRLTCKVTVADKRTSFNASSLGGQQLEVSIGNTHASENIQSYSRYMKVNNTQVTVMYGGKDVTGKAVYEAQLASRVSMNVDVDENGMISDDSCGMMSCYDDPKLIVAYKGMTKTIPVKVTETCKYYVECYCGEGFNDTKELWVHGHNCPLSPGYYVVPYFVYDIIEVK